MKPSDLLFYSLIAISSILPTVSSIALPETLNNLFINAEIFNSTKPYSGPNFFDAIINDLNIPFTEPHGNATVIPDAINSHTLTKRALKRYNYLKFKVTLTGHVNVVVNTNDPGHPWYFKCTSADLYIFDRIGRNARDLVLVWRDPNGGNAVPGSIFWMTNRRLFSFLKPGLTTEPVLYTDTVPTIWDGYNKLLAFESRHEKYNPRNQFTGYTTWFLSNFLPKTVRNGGMAIRWEDGPKRISGAIDVRTLGFPLYHEYYLATIEGKFHSKGYRYL